nr:unnamed protein product [Leishmania braziliensis]
MSLHFNWSRLDETCAEALRQLINKRLAEVVERINSQHAASPSSGAVGSASAAAKMSTTIPVPLSGVAGTATSSSTSPYGGGGGSAAVAGKSECLPNASSGISPETLAGFIANPASTAAGASANRWESISNPSVSSTLMGVSTPHPSNTQAPYGSAGLPAFGAAAPASTAEMLPTGSACGSGNSASGPPITAALPHNSGYHGGGATLLAADINSGNNGGEPSESTSFVAEPITVPAMGVYRTTVSSSSSYFGPASSTVAASCAAATSAAGGAAYVPGTVSAPPAPAAAESASRVPLIEYLEVGRVEWGTTPPFVEIVAFENAIDGPPGRTRQHLQQQQQGKGLFGGGRDGQGTGPETRGTSPYTVSHTTSLDTLMTTSTAAVEPVTSPAAVTDNINENSNGIASRVHTGAKMLHLMIGSRPLLDTASADSSGAGGEVDMSSHRQPASSAPSQFPSQPEPVDSLTSVLGPGGLYVRFHVTYGGAMHLSMNMAVQHEIRLGAVALRVSLPMMFYLANLDLDCYLCVNMKDNMCEVWLEPGPLSPFVVNRLSITAVIGGDDDDDGGSDLEGGRKNAGTGDYGASSADFYSPYCSSSLSDGDSGEEGNGVYVNEHEVSYFVLHELRAILRETLIAPHSIRIPLSFGGGGGG